MSTKVLTLRWMFLAVLAAMIGLSLTGCATVSYYGQAVKGHWQITTGKKDIRRLLKDPELTPELKARLRTVQAVRRFAVEQLLLPDSGSYTDYVDLQRDTTLWLLSAAPAYSLTPRHWCYPFVGCFNYRGYFDRAQADAQVARLTEQGWDVVLAPGLAYSTLGFSNDPVLSTMLRYSDEQLAGVLFHELAHERLYVRNDSTFNESFATAVETIGRQRWAKAVANLSPASNFQDLQPASGELTAAQAATADRRQQFDELVINIREQLEALYSESNEDATSLAAKNDIFQQFKRRHEALKVRWDGVSPIDHWFANEGPNNARIALYSTYELEVPAFLEVFRQCDDQLECFYRQAQLLADMQPAARTDRLRELGHQARRRNEVGQ